jgi:hypothetical protein
MKDLADQYGTDVESLRRNSNVGVNVADDADLTPLQEQNVRGTWEQTSASTQATPEPSGDSSAPTAKNKS